MPIVDPETQRAFRVLRDASQNGTMDERQRRKKDLVRLLSQLFVGTIVIASCPAMGFLISYYASR